MPIWHSFGKFCNILFLHVIKPFYHPKLFIMSYENFPSGSTPPEVKPVQKKADYRNLIMGALVAGLLGTWGYIIYDKNQNKQVQTQLITQRDSSNSSNGQLQTELNDATAKIDMLKTTNA